MNQSGSWLCLSVVQFLVLSVPLSNAARILGIVPFEAKSHMILMSSLLKELALRGHQLTVITAIPEKNVPSNYTQIATGIKKEDFIGEAPNMFEFGDMGHVLMMWFMYSMGNTLTELTLKSTNVQNFLHSREEKFDLLITETFFVEALLGFSQKFNIPFVSVATFSGTENIKDTVGDPFPYAYVPSPLTAYTDHMTYFQRLHNTVIHFLSKLGHILYFIPAQDAIMRKYFTDVPNLPPLADIVRNSSLLLLNTHFSHGFPRPTNPNSIEVGGMHIKPPKKLPEDIKRFLDNAKNGVIYFSMGSNIKSSDMSIPKQEAFLKAFAKLSQKVLWKYEENLQGVPENVKIAKWFPQSDILGHPNIRAFMTHGGLLSSQEAMYNAVPLVGIPIFADQKLNVLRAAQAGYALQLDFRNVTETSVYWTLNEIVSNPKYKLTAKQVSTIFHDRQQTPMEEAIYWVEYVLRHKGAPHLRTAALDLSWYQYYLLDVIAVLLVSAASVLAILVYTFKMLVSVFLPKPEKKSIKLRKKIN